LLSVYEDYVKDGGKESRVKRQETRFKKTLSGKAEFRIKEPPLRGGSLEIEGDL
jgi:hypothetical protein